MPMAEHAGLHIGVPRNAGLPFEHMTGDFAGKMKSAELVDKAKPPPRSEDARKRAGEEELLTGDNAKRARHTRQPPITLE